MLIAKSGFLPSFFTFKTPVTETPVVTLTFAAGIGVTMSLYFQYYPEYINVVARMIDICSYIVFMNAFIAYLLFQRKYSSLPRSFRNPFGVWGAYYGVVNNLLGFVSVFKYSVRHDVINAVYCLLIFLGCATIFYWVYLVNRQTFSDEEKNLMFKAYLINGKNVLASKYILVTIIPSLANREKRQRILRNNRVTNSSIALKSNQSNVTQSRRFFVYIL